MFEESASPDHFRASSGGSRDSTALDQEAMLARHPGLRGASVGGGFSILGLVAIVFILLASVLAFSSDRFAQGARLAARPVQSSGQASTGPGATATSGR